VGFHQYKSEWICFEHIGFPRQKAERWWRARSNDAVPATAQEAVDAADADALAVTHEITIRSTAGQKFDAIVDYKLGDKPEAVLVDDLSQASIDEIPF
jgi:DNA repair protein RadD